MEDGGSEAEAENETDDEVNVCAIGSEDVNVDDEADDDAYVCAAEHRFQDSSMTRLFGTSGGSIGNVSSDADVVAVADPAAATVIRGELFEAWIGTPAEPKASPASLGCLSSMCFFMAEIRTNFFRQTGQLKVVVDEALEEEEEEEEEDEEEREEEVLFRTLLPSWEARAMVDD